MEITPQKVSVSFCMATTYLLINLHATGTLLGPVANLDRLGMSYKKCE